VIDVVFALAILAGFSALVVALLRRRSVAWKLAALAGALFIVALGLELSLRMPE